MKTKPLYRSLTFWAGLFVVLFLLWLWIDSIRFSSFGYVHAFGRSATFAMDPPHEIEITFEPHGSSATRAGKLAIGKMPPPPIPKWIHAGMFPRIPHPMGQEKPVFLKPRFGIHHRAHPSHEDTLYLTAPFWLLLTLHGLLWGGALLFRARRIRKGERLDLTEA